MQLHNLKCPDQQVNFKQAVLRGLGRDNGLFFPRVWPRIAHVDELLAQNFSERSANILQTLIGDEIDAVDLHSIVAQAFAFAPQLKTVSDHRQVLELFHGPTLAFKDYGARFMAQVLSYLIARGEHQGPLTILSATSGDTGAAVAHAFHGLKNVQVVILYPKGRISALQEKMFCTLGGNIHTLAVEGDFDQCQALVKAAFGDATLIEKYGLNSANSINISRLLAQVCYYVEAIAQSKTREQLVFSVPSGNFGNLTAGLIAQAIGFPIKAFIAATNSNDTVPRYLQTGVWEVHPTVATISNAMDVSAPNNWPRSESLIGKELVGNVLGGIGAQTLRACVVNESDTVAAMRALQALHYIAEPHTAIAFEGLRRHLQAGENGIFLSTAHPAKFQETVQDCLHANVALPPELAAVVDKPLLSSVIPAQLSSVQMAIAKAWS